MGKAQEYYEWQEDFRAQKALLRSRMHGLIDALQSTLSHLESKDVSKATEHIHKAIGLLRTIARQVLDM